MKYIVLVFYLFVLHNSFSQGISLDLSIEWKDDCPEMYKFFHSAQGKDLSRLPFLKFTFQNTTDENVYFFFNRPSIYPPILYDTWNYDFEDCDFPTADKLYDPDKNYIFIYKNNNSWDISERKDVDVNWLYNNAYTMYNHVKIAREYDMLILQKTLNEILPDHQLICFNYPDKKSIDRLEAVSLIRKNTEDYEKEIFREDSARINIESFMKYQSNNFHLLKRGEKKEFTIDLFPMYLMGGRWTYFIFNPEGFDKSYFRGARKPGETGIVEINFPKNYKGYKLYEGSIETDTLVVEF